MTDQAARIARVFSVFFVFGLLALIILNDVVERDCYRDHPEITPNGGWPTPCTSRINDAPD